MKDLIIKGAITMTENEMLKIAVHCLGVQAEQEVCEECDIYGNCHTDCKDVAVVAIKALEEVQQYREIGSVEQMKNQKENLSVAYRIISDYESIGTVEECRKAVEKQKAKKCDVTKDNFRIYYKCPTCNHCLRVEYNHGSWMGKKSKNCSKCGQAIQWDEN